MFAYLIASVILIESSANVRALSNKGAVGLMQITPIGLEEVREQYGVYLKECPDLFDPYVNVDVGSRLLSFYLDVSDGDVKGALALYNGGYRAYKHYKRGTLYKIKETNEYLKKVCRVYMKCNTKLKGPY